MKQLLTAAVLCNGAALHEQDGVRRVIGDPTEAALLVLAEHFGMTKHALEREAPLESEIPFDAERKMMTIIRRSPAGNMAYVKGAPDVLLPRCTHRLRLDGHVEPLDEGHRQEILATNGVLAGQALRVLAVAHRLLNAPQAKMQAATIEQELVFLGLVAMKDPLRPEAVDAVRLCREAGGHHHDNDYRRS
jgi:Ca2+-transporting ATPase